MSVKQHQLDRADRLGQPRREHVGVDVERLAVGAGGQRRHHRDEVRQQPIEHGAIDRGDLADQAQLGAPHLGLGQPAIAAGQPDRGAAEVVDQPHQLRVELAAQHHLDDLELRRVGDALPVDERRLVAEPIGERGDLLAAAVDHHHVDADPVEQDQILGEPLPQRRVVERDPADLDHHGLAAKLRDERQGLDEHPRLGDDCFHGRAYYPKDRNRSRSRYRSQSQSLGYRMKRARSSSAASAPRRSST
jgi:hypothetical protein